jgi:hypothetical protein
LERAIIYIKVTGRKKRVKKNPEPKPGVLFIKR